MSVRVEIDLIKHEAALIEKLISEGHGIGS